MCNLFEDFNSFSLRGPLFGLLTATQQSNCQKTQDLPTEHSRIFVDEEKLIDKGDKGSQAETASF